jgi:hypothetical protein
MNRDLLHKIIIELETILNKVPDKINETSIEAKLNQLVVIAKKQNKNYARMIKAIETLNCKNSCKSEMNTTLIEEKLDSIWEILYDTKNNINS